MISKNHLILLFFLGWAFLSSAQVCSPLAYDGFTDNAGLPLHNIQDGSGWGGNWVVQNNNNTVPGYQISSSPVLSYLDLQKNGHIAAGGNAYLTAGRRFDTASNGPFQGFLNADGLIGADNTTIWFSCMLQKPAANSQPLDVSLHQNNIEWYNAGNRIGAGYFGTASEQGGIRYWSLQINDSIYRTNVQVVTGQTALLVLGISFLPNDTVSVSCFVNPATIGNNMPAPLLTRTLVMSFGIRALSLYCGNSAANGYVDEIRMADSYRCAVPDASVQVNNPPIANFTATPGQGNAPLSVNFDASASSDDGGIVSYTWNFGDGTTGTGINPTHIFSSVGVIPVQLTVVDAFGATHTRTSNLVITDANGHLPCLTSLSLLQMATCGQNNGSFQFYNDGQGATYTLKDASNNSYTPVNTVYSNLHPGIYSFTVSGNFACADTFQVHIPVDSSTCAGWQADTCKLQIGMGLSGVAYWNRERAFKNLALASSEFFTYNASGDSPWNTGVMNEIPVDSNGYPLQIPFTTSLGPQNVRLVLSADGYIPIGDYVFLYEGEGAFQFFGINVISSQPGRILVHVNYTGNVWLHITSSQSGNPVRNFRLLRTTDEATYATAPFYQGFLDRLNLFKSIRFMDWGATNNSNLVHWSERSRKTYHTQAVPNGVSYEWMIRLCNTLHKDAWVCVPHQADDDYMTQMAQLFKDSLDPDLHIYLEYSNEVWNWQFEQSHWVDNHRPSNLSYPRAYAERAKHLFQIWKNVFAEQGVRVERVLGTQVGWSWVGQQILGQAGANSFDYFSPTWYFGYNADACGLNASSTAADVINCAKQLFENGGYQQIRQARMDAAMYGKEMVLYEGGQHMTSNPNTVPFQQAVYDAQINPLMYSLYTEVLDSLTHLGSKMAMAFVLASIRESVYGSWGHIEDIDQNLSTQPAPKYQALLDHLPACCNLATPQITGQASVCINGENTYSVAQIPGATYQWIVTGGTIQTGQGTHQITVHWNSNTTGSVQIIINQ